MRQVLRDAVWRDSTDSEVPDHLGLAYDGWAPTEVADGKVSDDERGCWLEKLAELAVSPDYAQSFDVWKSSFTASGDRLTELTLQSRLLVGHGNSSATGVGLTVHHTWGVPIIPGSALKGLVAHYVDATYGPTDPSKKPWEQQSEERSRADYQGVSWNRRRIERGPGAVYRALFGAPDAHEDATMRDMGFAVGAAGGVVTFHDALYVPRSAEGDKPFAADVLTVHQKGYYDSTGRTAPNDYNSPNPVAFLTVRPKCRLFLALSGPSEWTELAAKLLKEALEQWGVGGKTAAGYGFGTVEEWKAPEPRRSKAEQVALELARHGRDHLMTGIEQWLRGETVTGAMSKLLTVRPGATGKEELEVVRRIGEMFDLRDVWTGRLKNKKADEAKKARTRYFIEEWNKLFPGGG